MFHKAMVIGCPGAGKSTFSRKLKEKTGLPLYHLDRIWHKPDKTNVSEEEFDQRLKEIAAKDQWIIDGNYSRTLEIRLRACDTVFLLDLPVEECLAGAAARVGVPHEDLPWIETELDEEFKQWILDFPQNTLPKIYEQLGEYAGKKTIYIFHSRQETDSYLEETFGPSDQTNQ